MLGQDEKLHVLAMATNVFLCFLFFVERMQIQAQNLCPIDIFSYYNKDDDNNGNDNNNATVIVL